MDEKEKTPQRGTYKKDDIESAKATAEYLKMIFSRDLSIDWQIENGLWTAQEIENPVKHFKNAIAESLDKAILILDSLL